MEPDFYSLYENLVNEHYENPQNFGELIDSTHLNKGYQAECGDRMIVFIKIQGDRITDIRFNCFCCAVSKTSASVMTSLLKGKTLEEAKVYYSQFKQIVTSKENISEHDSRLPKDLILFSVLKDLPFKQKCALLPWDIINKIINDPDKSRV